MIGRLPSGAGITEVATHAEVVASRLQSAYPNTNRNRRFTLTRLGEGRGLRVTTRPILWQLTGAVLMVLMVACANVASLLLSRAMSREREVAVRVAIGASRARLFRQWLTESVLLGVCGSIAALLVIRLATPLLHTFALPEAVDLSVNARVLVFTLIVGVGSGLLFGLAPAVQLRRNAAAASLRAAGPTVATGARAARMRGAFVMLQVAVSLVLLVGAGLFLRTLKNAYAVELGYNADQILVASLDLQARGYIEGGSRSPDAGLTIYEQILSRVEALPGVIASGAAREGLQQRPGRPRQRRQPSVLRNDEHPGPARALFQTSDGSRTARVAVVSRSLADRVWPHADPIGKTFCDERNQFQVVGIVPDTVYTSTLERERPPTYYLLLAQNYESGVTLHVRAAGNPMSLVPRIREAVRQVDSELALERPQLLGEVWDQTLSAERMMATLVGLFGAIALVLAALGLYGVLAHAASQRTVEIGIRLAMGAQPASIVSLLVGQGLRLLGIGAAIGLTGAFVATQYVEAQLFGVTATDPITFLSGCAVLAVAGLTASLVPALRAMRVDPAIALRRV